MLCVSLTKNGDRKPKKKTEWFVLFFSFATELTAATENVDAKSTMIENRQNKAITPNCPRTCPVLTTPEQPVCGSDGLIYANSCEMKKKTCSRNGVANVKVSSHRLWLDSPARNQNVVGEIFNSSNAARAANITKSLKIHDSVLRKLLLSLREREKCMLFDLNWQFRATVLLNGWVSRVLAANKNRSHQIM